MKNKVFKQRPVPKHETTSTLLQAVGGAAGGAGGAAGAAGGGMSKVPFGAIGGIAGGLVSNIGAKQTAYGGGFQGVGAATAGGALAGAGAGADMGKSFGAMGMAVGAGLGALVGGTSSFIRADKAKDAALLQNNVNANRFAQQGQQASAELQQGLARHQNSLYARRGAKLNQPLAHGMGCKSCGEGKVSRYAGGGGLGGGKQPSASYNPLSTGTTGYQPLQAPMPNAIGGYTVPAVEKLSFEDKLRRGRDLRENAALQGQGTLDQQQYNQLMQQVLPQGVDPLYEDYRRIQQTGSATFDNTPQRVPPITQKPGVQHINMGIGMRRRGGVMFPGKFQGGGKAGADQSGLQPATVGETVVDQIPYIGRLKNLGTAAYSAYKEQPFQAMLELAKIPKVSNAYVDGLFNHLQPYAERMDREVYPRIRQKLTQFEEGQRKKALIRRKGGVLFARYANGGAVILGGQRHGEGGKMGEGNPVVDAQGEKVAETETEELLLSLAQTQEVEGLIAQYEQSKDVSVLTQLGGVMRRIIEGETEDKSGTYNLEGNGGAE